MTSTEYAVASLRLSSQRPLAPPMSTAGVMAKWTARLVTVVRIPIAIAGIVFLYDGLRIAAVAAFALFAAIDVVDGVAARSVGCDTAARRAGDVLIDRSAIHLAALSCCLIYSTGWLAWLVLLSRDVAQGIISLRFTRRTKTLVIGAHWHMSYGLSMLIWGSAFIVLGYPPAILTVLTALVSLVTFLHYHRRCAQIEATYLV